MKSLAIFESGDVQEIKEYLENIIALMPGHVYWKNIEGFYIGCNDLQAKDAGLVSRLEIVGKNDFDMPWKEQAEALRRVDLEVIKTGIPKTVEEVSILANGTKSIFLSQKVPLFHRSEIVGIVGISFDITEKKSTEEELRETKLRLENIINTIPGHVYWKDCNGVLLGCNDQQAKAAGLSSKEEIVGKTDYDMPWKEQADDLRSVDTEVVSTGAAKTVEEVSVLADGKRATFLSKKVPLYQDDQIVGILGISFDITEQKRTEEELQETRHKLEGMTLVGASIAHELRTPLATLNVGIDNLKQYLPDLVHAYRLAEQAGLPVRKIKSDNLALLQDIFSAMGSEIRSAFTFIDMLLMNVNPVIEQGAAAVFSMAACVNKALERYPFQEGQKALVQWDNKYDFLVRGKELLIIHILFNLLKNALYYVAKARKGAIFIRLEDGNPYNKLYFKDTGTGIAADNLPHIFDRFFSKTSHGAGIGLTFCKMVMEAMKGKITCASQEGDFTEFVLYFPASVN